MNRTTCAALAAALLALPVTAPAASAAAAADEGARPKERKICKLSNDTATRMASRTCLTRTQWRALARRHSKENATAEAENESMLRSQADMPALPSGEGGTLPAPGYPK